MEIQVYDHYFLLTPCVFFLILQIQDLFFPFKDINLNMKKKQNSKKAGKPAEIEKEKEEAIDDAEDEEQEGDVEEEEEEKEDTVDASADDAMEEEDDDEDEEADDEEDDEEDDEDEDDYFSNAEAASYWSSWSEENVHVIGLVDNDVVKRTRALKRLKAFLKTRSADEDNPFEEKDLLKIWKGLHYSMWHSDKLLVRKDVFNLFVFRLFGLMESVLTSVVHMGACGIIAYHSITAL